MYKATRLKKTAAFLLNTLEVINETEYEILVTLIDVDESRAKKMIKNLVDTYNDNISSKSGKKKELIMVKPQ